MAAEDDESDVGEGLEIGEEEEEEEAEEVRRALADAGRLQGLTILYGLARSDGRMQGTGFSVKKEEEGEDAEEAEDEEEEDEETDSDEAEIEERDAVW